MGRGCVRKSGTFSARGLGLKKQKLMEEESGGHGSKEDGEERLEGAEQKAWGCQGKEHVYEAARKC